jgi:hypothetical protein
MEKHNALQSHIILLLRCCHGRRLDVVVMEGKFTLPSIIFFVKRNFVAK